MFCQAKPIFAKGKSEELNVFASFEARVGAMENAKIAITASSFYRLWVNGKFLAFGPARTAEGYARVDEIELGTLTEKENTVTVEVVGYYCRSLSTVFQPSFLCAEITCDQEIIAYTGRDFTAYLPETKLQKVMRYTVQRHFSEVWDLTDKAIAGSKTPVEAEILPLNLSYLSRTAPYAYYEDLALTESCSRGNIATDPEKPPREKIYSFLPNKFWGCFEGSEIPYHPYEWLYGCKQTKTAGGEKLPLTLKAGEYAIFDPALLETGFLFFEAYAHSDSDLVIGYAEDGSPDLFEYCNISGYNALEYLLQGGKSTSAMSFEPYTCRWMIVCVKKGEVTLEKLGIKRFENNVSNVKIPALPTKELESIYSAAIRTYAHNAVDVYSDCPSRERAGWLCDSYFTAKSEYALFGTTAVEDAFLENYRLYRYNGDLPRGMIPMCFPADVPEAGRGQYIPQWSMWYIVELEEYLNQRNPAADRELFRASVEGLLAFYAQYENEDGLLEKLPNWNFVEWSVANQWTLDVNYPTNFLYAQVLESAYRIFGDEKLLCRAQKVREKTIEQSFNGSVFLDHAVRDESGKLNRLDDCSEACQYYALLFGDISLDDSKFATLKHLVLEEFTPDRTSHPEIHPVNAFIGAYLRLEVLMKFRQYELLLSDITGFFGHMGKTTGTLWEYRQPKGSRDHGFASYALVAIKQALGL